MVMRVAGWLTARIFEAFYFSYVNTEFSAGHFVPVGTTSGIITSMVMMIILGGMFLYMFYYLCSEGYSHLPRKVMSWIGHDSTTMGIATASEAMRQVIVGGVGRGTRSRSRGKIMPKFGDNNGSGGKKGSQNTGANNPHTQGEAMPGTGSMMSNPDKHKK